MLCEKCQENEATIHYTELVNGVRAEHHLCSACAQTLDLSGYANVLNSDFPFARLLTGLFAAGRASSLAAENPMAHVVCPKCGMNYEEFTHVGKFGCSECYNVFGPLIDENMKKIHGNNVHTGKKYHVNPEGEAENAAQKTSIPKMSKEEELLLLQAKLKEAIELENYEDAAHLRDTIKALQTQ